MSMSMSVLFLLFILLLICNSLYPHYHLITWNSDNKPIHKFHQPCGTLIIFRPFQAKFVPLTDFLLDEELSFTLGQIFNKLLHISRILKNFFLIVVDIEPFKKCAATFLEKLSGLEIFVIEEFLGRVQVLFDDIELVFLDYDPDYFCQNYAVYVLDSAVVFESFFDRLEQQKYCNQSKGYAYKEKKQSQET